MPHKMTNGLIWPDMPCLNCGKNIWPQTQLTGFFDFSPSMPSRTMYTASCGDCDQAYMVFFVDRKLIAKYTIDDLWLSQRDREQWPRRVITMKNGSFL